jgi:DNA-binding MarR family transcriptional regulator
VIAEALEMSEVSAGRLVDRLCAEGLLERRPRADDRRAFSIHLTDAATPVLEKLAETARIAEEQVFRGFNAEQLAMMRDMLDKLAGNINAPVLSDLDKKEGAGA